MVFCVLLFDKLSATAFFPEMFFSSLFAFSFASWRPGRFISFTPCCVLAIVIARCVDDSWLHKHRVARLFDFDAVEILDWRIVADVPLGILQFVDIVILVLLPVLVFQLGFATLLFP